MQALSYQKLNNRWDALPLSLREALYSESGSDFLWKTCEDEHIPDGKIHDIARIVGYVLMGFLHPEDMAKEVQDATNIDPRIVAPITAAVNQRVFVPLRPDIDRVYNSANAISNTSPKIVEEIRPASKTPVPTGAPLPTKISMMQPARAPRPTPISTPAPMPKPQDSPARASLPNVAKPAENVPPPKPVILQSEAIPHPILNAPNFRMPTNAEDIMSTKNGPAPTPVRSAVVEFGNMPAPRATSLQASPAGRTPLTQQAPISIKPLGTEPARTVTEITPEALKNFAPTPVTPPRPSFTPISQIPIPSPIAPKPQIASASVPPSPVTFSPMPQPQKPPVAGIPMPQPANQPEKVVRKDYSETEK